MYNFLGLTHAHTHSRREEITEQPQKYKNHPKKTNNSAAVHKTPWQAVCADSNRSAREERFFLGN